MTLYDETFDGCFLLFLMDSITFYSLKNGGKVYFYFSMCKNDEKLERKLTGNLASRPAHAGIGTREPDKASKKMNGLGCYMCANLSRYCRRSVSGPSGRLSTLRSKGSKWTPSNQVLLLPGWEQKGRFLSMTWTQPAQTLPFSSYLSHQKWQQS